MKFAIKYFLLLLVVYLFPIGGVAQSPQFTQFYANKLYLAPSFAGATKQYRLTAVYRNQWVGIPGGFNTYAVSFDHYFANFNSGLGLLVLRDEAGAGNLGLLNMGILYSYDFMINEYWHIRPGIHFLYAEYGINFQNLVFKDQITRSGILPVSITDAPSHEKVSDVDASTSVLAYNDRYWFGATVDHLLRPNQSFYADDSKIPVKVSLFGGMQVIRKGRLLRPIDETLSIAYLYRQQADMRQLDAGLYWYKSPMVLGIWYRGIPVVNSPRGDALAFVAGFKVDNFSIGYSYDFTISNLITSTRGAHEISMVYEFVTSPRKRVHAIPCPEF